MCRDLIPTIRLSLQNYLIGLSEGEEAGIIKINEALDYRSWASFSLMKAKQL